MSKDELIFYNTDKQATTTVGHGPRGNYYEWCKLKDDGTLMFGEEEGNYAGGETLSREWVFTTYDDNLGVTHGLEYRGNDVTEAIYLEAVRKEMLDIIKHKPLFFMNIIELLIKNNADEWMDRIRQWTHDEEVREHEEHAESVNGWVIRKEGSI